MPETTDLSLIDTDAVIVPADTADVVRVTGADRVAFLGRVTTGPVAGATAGGGTRTLLLETKGHVVADLVACVLDAEVRLLAPAGQGEAAAAALARYAIMDDVVFAPWAGAAVLAVVGPRTAERLEAAGVVGAAEVVGKPLFAHAAAGDVWLVRWRASGRDGCLVVGDAAAVQAVEARLGLPTLAPALADALRIAAGEPRFGVDVTGDYFPMEVGRQGAIDYAKGCYLGQEPIVRIRDRGHINWRLARLTFEAGAELPQKGDPLETDARPRAGRVTSAAKLPDGAGVALALVHVSVAVGTAVRIRRDATTFPGIVGSDVT